MQVVSVLNNALDIGVKWELHGNILEAIKNFERE